MQSQRSHLSTVRRLSTAAAAQETNAHASALAEMDAAISRLGDWQRQRELDIARLKVCMMREDGEDEDDAAVRKVLSGGGSSESDRGSTFLTAADSHTASGRANGGDNDNADDGDDDPASRAYEGRLRAELAALQDRREKLERQSLAPSVPAAGTAPTHHHMPTDLLISKDQIDELTKDTRSHVGTKSVLALRSEVRELEAAAFDKQLRAEQSVVTDPEMLREEDVTRVAKEEHGLTEVFGLGNALSEYMSGLDDMMLKLDAVDAAVEASQLSSGRSARRDDREEMDDGEMDEGEEEEGSLSQQERSRAMKVLRNGVEEISLVPPVLAAPDVDVASSPGAEHNICEGRGGDVLVPESF